MITSLHPDGQFRRSDPPFDELTPIFGLTPVHVDEAFLAASKLCAAPHLLPGPQPHYGSPGKVLLLAKKTGSQ
jgi:hypothetical protein